MQGNPKAKCLKSSPLLFPDLCISLFQNVVATGDGGWGPSCNHSRPGTSQVAPPPLLELPSVGAFQDYPDTPGNQSNTGTNYTPASNPPNATDPPNATNLPKADFSGGKANKRRKTGGTVDVESKMVQLLDVMLKKHNGFSVDACVEKLNKLGWDSSNPLYVTATSIFCEGQSYRDMWMRYEDADVAGMEAWIKMVGRRFGLV
jgi:hypothetical protein